MRAHDLAMVLDIMGVVAFALHVIGYLLLAFRILRHAMLAYDVVNILAAGCAVRLAARRRSNTARASLGSGRC